MPDISFPGITLINLKFPDTFYQQQQFFEPIIARIKIGLFLNDHIAQITQESPALIWKSPPQ